MPINPARVFAIPALSLSLAALAVAQWSDRKLIGNGGESTVVTDGRGNVYVTTHQECRLYASHDWGASFTLGKTFDDAFCDLSALAWPNGDLNVAFIKLGISGMASYYSTDNAQTLHKGVGVDGHLDREWLAPNLVNGDLYMDYSNGYIGGSFPFLGVYLAVSKDKGKTFKQTSRVDKEPSEDHGVDPYLTTSSDGRIYAMWSTTKDNNTIDRFDYSYSTDNGKTFKGHQTIGSLHKDNGDTQERWILGCITASGKNNVLAIYPDYQPMTVDGVEYKPLLLYYRLSTDGGVTFSPPKTVSSAEEIQACISSFVAAKKKDTNVPYYVQTLPWTCADPYGRFYIAYQDNRDGQVATGDSYCDRWHVRVATMPMPVTGSGTAPAVRPVGFGSSERVSDDVTCMRPPLDFLSCAADKTRLYVSWTENASTSRDWPFTGKTFLGRKILHAPAEGQ